VSRKTIQDVNVRKAVNKIIDPGAPLALRLQGNLLYGVSRVYSQQCTYMLVDAEKLQSDMKLLFRGDCMNQIDHRAGKSKYVWSHWTILARLSAG
jgi:meiotic recombination protein REC8, fungi type